MKKFIILSLLFIIAFPIFQIQARDINFFSQPEDSSWQKSYCWQSGNSYRLIFSLDGEWEYQVAEKDSLKKVNLPAVSDYWGEITFRKSFVPDSTFTGRFFRLVCYGINYYCRIFINDKFIGSHTGGYSSFAFDIADGIIQLKRKNIIEIKVDTRLDSKKTIPHRFQPDGIVNTPGIFRSIYLLAIPELSIEDVEVNYQLLPDFSQCDLEINFILKDRIDEISNQEFKKGNKPALQYYVELSTKDSKVPVYQERKAIDVSSYVLTKTISAQFKIKQPQLWSPEFPHLYSLQIILIQGKQVIDQFNQSVGFKQIQFRNGNIYLNGEHLVLKGINWVENYSLNGALFDRNTLFKDLELVKQLHANAIRVLHHPAHPMLTSLCDSLGLFLLQEIPLDWTPSVRFESENFVNYCFDYLYETINRDHHHVSVFAWGIGGHLLFSEPITSRFIDEITTKLKKISKQPFYIWNPFFLKSDQSDTNLIGGISVFNDRKDEVQTRLSEWLNQKHDQPGLVLSFGAPHLGVSIDNSNNALFEERQVLLTVEAWSVITGYPEIDGYFVSTLSDFESNYQSSMYGNCINGCLRPFGLTDIKKKKRVSYETVRSLYQEGKARYNPGIEIKSEMPAAFPLIGLGTILIFLFMVNSRRYFRENVKRIFIHPHGFYVDIRDGRKIPPSHTIFIALFISLGCGLILASLVNFFKNQPQIDHLMTILLTSEKLKMKFCYLSWNPPLAVIIFTILSFIIFLSIVIYFKGIGLITRKRCSIVQSMIIPFWIGGNFILFIPLGMILFRLMNYQNLIIPAFVMIFLVLIWFTFRMAKGMRVMFIWSMSRSLIVLFVTLIAISAGILYYYQSQYALIDYLKFYFQIYGENILSANLY